MQIHLDSNISRIQLSKFGKKDRTNLVTMPEIRSYSHTNFTAAPVIKKTVSSQIAHEKSKLMKQIRDILATEVHIMSEEEKLLTRLKRFQSFMRNCMQREKEIEEEMKSLVHNPMLNSQQRMDQATKLKKEYEKLQKTKFVEPPEKEPSKDNYDYALIYKFKNALLEDNFDFGEIQRTHYEDLANITTVEEFKRKYPSIRIPANPQDVIIDKILNTLDRSFYLKLDHLCDSLDADMVTEWTLKFYESYFDKISSQFKTKSTEDLIVLLAQKLTRKILENLERYKTRDEFDTIPQVRKSSVPTLSELDKELLDINYDKFILETLKKIYLNGEKLNQIEYVEGDKKISIGAIKLPEYKFEKIPEKIKKIINDTRKALSLQTDYQNFNIEELQARLDFYTTTDVANSPEIYKLMVDFACCRFTEEDRQYLIKFLQTLDQIKAKKITTKDAVKYLKTNKIRPHGTVKLNEMERKYLEEKIKQEQLKITALNALRTEFNNAINKLYEINLPAIAERLSKFYPETTDTNKMEEAKEIVNVINENLALKKTNKIKSGILRWEIFKDYSEIMQNSEEFKQALIYGNLFEKADKVQRSGQYLLNREIIKGYPNSLSHFQYPKILEKIMEKFGYDIDLATKYLCKYEDYAMMDKNEKSSIANILNIFDIKNANDRVLIKNIIENDYVNLDTVYTSIENSQTVETIIDSKAKKAILDKHLFPGCIDLFVAFEDALSLRATESGTSGVKNTSSNNSARTYKMELKIMGYPDRLFSSKNDYRFDIYSDKGLH